MAGKRRRLPAGGKFRAALEGSNRTQAEQRYAFCSAPSASVWMQHNLPALLFIYSLCFRGLHLLQQILAALVERPFPFICVRMQFNA